MATFQALPTWRSFMSTTSSGTRRGQWVPRPVLMRHRPAHPADLRRHFDATGWREEPAVDSPRAQICLSMGPGVCLEGVILRRLRNYVPTQAEMGALSSCSESLRGAVDIGSNGAEAAM